MDTWKFYAITHHDHVVCNPTSTGKLADVVGLLDLPVGAHVLDIACGKGELLLRLAETYGHDPAGGFHGVGVDLSPYCIADVRRAAARRAPTANLDLLEMSGADYRPEAGAFDLASCLGASWIFDGHPGTLRALCRAVRPGGQVLVGEPFWRTSPDPAYLAWSGLRADQFASHADNVAAGATEGLMPLLALVSDGDEWDRYETLQWRAAARYAAANPADPDLPELLERVERNRHEYLSWGRETLGWALYLFGRP